MEYDHTISGLLRKRDEIAKAIERTQRQLSDLTADLDYIDNALRIVSPDYEVPGKAYPPAMAAFKGEMARFVLGHLRNASEPSTSLEIAHTVMDGRGLNKNDRRAVVTIRKRVGACLGSLKRRGVVLEVESAGEYKRWKLK